MIRNFTLTNALGASFSLMNAQQGAFFEPQGLGFDDATQYEQVGEFFAPLTQKYGQQVITGSMVFGSQPYEHYLTFTKFCQHAPLSLVYETDAGTFQIPCRLTKIEKGDTDGWTYLECKVEFTALARMYKTVTANNTGTAGGGKVYLAKDLPDITGSIITIDNAEAGEILNITADIDPIQDLHGYDKPWVGGAGVNQWDEEWELGNIYSSTGQNGDSTTSFRSKNYIPIIPNTQYYCKIPTTIGLRWYRADKTYIEAQGVSTSSVVTSPSDAYYLRFVIGLTTYNNDIAINYPSSVTTYSPYENICPISGWSGVDVYDDPKHGGIIEWNQLVNGMTTRSNYEGITTSYADGVISIENISRTTNYTSGSSRMPVSPDGSCIVGHKYIATGVSNKSITGVGLHQITSGGTENYTFCPVNSIFVGITNGYFMLRINNTYDFASTHQIGDITDLYLCIFDLTEMFGAGNEPTTVDEFKALFPKDYYAYNSGTTTCVSAVNGEPYGHHTTTLPSTTYGGTLDLVSGELTVTHVKWTGNTADMDNSNDCPGWRSAGIATLMGTGLNNLYPNVWTNVGRGIGVNTVSTNDVLMLPKSYYGLTQTEWIALAEDIEILIELATPQTYQLTPQQIQTLLGQNNVWANSGNITITGRKTYGYEYNYTYGDFVADTVTIDSDSVTASPCRISIFGECTQPTWRHYLDGNSVATGYYNGTIPSGHKLVIDTTSSPYSIEEQDIAGNLIADRYELCDFSTERFFLLEYGHNTISVSHTDPDSIRLMVEGYIFYETV